MYYDDNYMAICDALNAIVVIPETCLYYIPGGRIARGQKTNARRNPMNMSCIVFSHSRFAVEDLNRQQ